MWTWQKLDRLVVSCLTSENPNWINFLFYFFSPEKSGSANSSVFLVLIRQKSRWPSRGLSRRTYLYTFQYAVLKTTLLHRNYSSFLLLRKLAAIIAAITAVTLWSSRVTRIFVYKNAFYLSRHARSTRSSQLVCRCHRGICLAALRPSSYL